MRTSSGIPPEKGCALLSSRPFWKLCPKAYRWVGEMEEISKTHEELDLPRNLFKGAADIYRLVETSPLGKEIVEDRKLGTSAENVADILADFLGK